MPTDSSPSYDAVLSFADADADAYGDRLAGLLYDANLRVWPSPQPREDEPPALAEALKRARKLVTIWTPAYFADAAKVAAAASFLKPYSADALKQERPLVALLGAECAPPAPFADIPCIDFTNSDDFALRFRELVEALDAPRPFAARADSW